MRIELNKLKINFISNKNLKTLIIGYFVFVAILADGCTFKHQETNTFINDGKYFKGKVVLLPSENDQIGIVSIYPKNKIMLESENIESYIFKKTEYICENVNLYDTIYFKLIEQSGIVIAENITKVIPEYFETSPNLSGYGKGTIDFRRRGLLHVQNNCLTSSFPPIHTKYHIQRSVNYNDVEITFNNDLYKKFNFTECKGNSEFDAYYLSNNQLTADDCFYFETKIVLIGNVAYNIVLNLTTTHNHH